MGHTISHVIRRSGRLHFRRTVPADLRARIGRRELTRSLGTADQHTAKLDAGRLYVASETLFRMARARPMLTTDQLARLVQDFYDIILERENVMRLRGEPLDEATVAGRESYYADLAGNARKALAANRFGEVRMITEGILRRQGIATAALATEDWMQARQAVLRAGIDVASALQARYVGDFNYEPRDRLLKLRLDGLPDISRQTVPAEASGPLNPATASAPATPAATSGPIFSEACASFLHSQVSSGAWENQSASQARATFRLFVDVCGNRCLGDYTRQDASLFKDQIQRLPGNYGKAAIYRGLDVAAIIKIHAGEKAETRLEPISVKTVKRHFSALSALWTEAQSKGGVSENIFTGFRYGASKRKAADQRRMWEREDLDGLFATPVWTGCESERHRSLPGMVILRDAKFWLPLIAVYSGMRQEEICQLRLEDVRREKDIWYFDLHARDGRMLKNDTAVRRVPIHETLIRLGLLDRVTDLRSRGATQLFPDLKGGGADNRLGHAYTKWFTRYRQDIGLYREGLDFHSFRHSATTFLHEAGVQDSVVDRLTGHVTPGETARYTKRTNLAQLKDAIDKIDIGVDISRLFVRP